MTDSKDSPSSPQGKPETITGILENADQEMEDCFAKSLESLSTTFAASAKRWEAIVYPSLFAFILLASYGFFLIYNLTTDVRRVADNMDKIVYNMSEISVNMKVMSNNMVIMTQTMDQQKEP